jgi:hypothetical protein
MRLCTQATMHTQSDVSTQDSSKRSKPAPESDIPHAVQRTNLQLILQYVGPKDWLYMAAVSRLWQQAYRRICEEHAKQQKAWVLNLRHCERCYIGVVTATRTSYSNALASLPRLQLACAFDLQLSSVQCLPLQAGMCADKQTLLYARAQGLPWSEAVCDGAAQLGKLDMLHWLHSEQQCPWRMATVVRAALRRADLPLLKWLHSTVPWKSFCEAAKSCIYEADAWGPLWAGSIALLAWLQVRL